VSTEELAERLSAIAEELGELAFDRLRRASSELSEAGEADPSLLSEERRLTRARRAVEKAVALLSGPPANGAGPPES
jgi:hypothetical protein